MALQPPQPNKPYKSPKAPFLSQTEKDIRVFQHSQSGLESEHPQRAKPVEPVKPFKGGKSNRTHIPPVPSHRHCDAKHAQAHKAPVTPQTNHPSQGYRANRPYKAPVTAKPYKAPKAFKPFVQPQCGVLTMNILNQFPLTFDGDGNPTGTGYLINFTIAEGNTPADPRVSSMFGDLNVGSGQSINVATGETVQIDAHCFDATAAMLPSSNRTFFLGPG